MLLLHYLFLVVMSARAHEVEEGLPISHTIVVDYFLKPYTKDDIIQ